MSYRAMTSTTLTFQIATRDLSSTLSRKAAEPMVSRLSEQYLKDIVTVKSVDDFLKNDRVFRYAMEAFGLGDMAYAKGFMRKVLEGGVDSRDSFANRLSDPRYKEFAAAFNFKALGPATTSFERVQQGAVDRYVRQKLEVDLGQQNDGVRLALYFQRKAGNITNAFQILADPALLKVVQTALGLPSQISNASIDRQADLIEQRIDFADFKDPAKLQKFLTRFTTLYDTQSGVPAANAPSVLIGGSVPQGVGTDILMKIQSLPFGGR